MLRKKYRLGRETALIPYEWGRSGLH